MPFRRLPGLALAIALAIGSALVTFVSGCQEQDFEISFDGPTAEWPVWGGTPGASHHSPLDQIDRANVGALKVAWTHKSGDYYDGSGSSKVTSLQVTPLVVNELLYYCTPFMRVFALDPETGAERWMFDPKLKDRFGEGPYPLICRDSPSLAPLCSIAIFVIVPASTMISAW